MVAEAVNCRTSSRSRACVCHSLWCLLLCIIAGTNTFATSSCYQWAGAQAGVFSGFYSDPVPACEEWVRLYYAAYPWAGTSWEYEGVVVDTFPSYKCKYQYTTTSGGPWQDETQLDTRANPNGCKVYVSVIPEPNALCGVTCNKVADPIDPVSGRTVSIDTDLARTAIPWGRYYNGATERSDGWRSLFSRNVKTKYAGTDFRPFVANGDNSSLYSDEASACTSGFAEIKSRVSAWSALVATYENQTCILRAGTVRVGVLPLFYSSPPTPDPSTLTVTGVKVTRDDGQAITFISDTGVLRAPGGIPMQLAESSSGYTLHDSADNIESYDASGKLTTVTSKSGLVKTLAYDSEGRLISVADNFGHTLLLVYDAQGRLSTVTSN